MSCMPAITGGLTRNSMRWFLKKVLRVLIAVFGASLLSFLLSANITGSAAAEAVSSTGADVTWENIAEMEEQLGLNASLPVRYARWLGSAVKGDFGRSYITGETVLKELSARVPATVRLTLYAFAVTLLFAIPLGTMAAVRDRHLDDRLMQGFTFCFMGIPTFVLGLLLAYFVSVRLKWLPMVGFGSWRYRILPTITLALPMTCRYIRLIKANILEVFNEEYIYLLRTRGFRERVILFHNALKNAFLPIISILGLGIGHALGGAVVVENIFSIPGLGSFLTLSINRRDYPVIQAYILLMTVVFLLINFSVDLISTWLDPRIRLSGRERE